MTDRAVPPPSFWLEDLDERLEPRPSLEGDEVGRVAAAEAIDCELRFSAKRLC
jgi:hypothetical protein